MPNGQADVKVLGETVVLFSSRPITIPTYDITFQTKSRTMLSWSKMSYWLKRTRSTSALFPSYRGHNIYLLSMNCIALLFSDHTGTERKVRRMSKGMHYPHQPQFTGSFNFHEILNIFSIHLLECHTIPDDIGSSKSPTLWCQQQQYVSITFLSPKPHIFGASKKVMPRHWMTTWFSLLSSWCFVLFYIGFLRFGCKYVFTL